MGGPENLRLSRDRVFSPDGRLYACALQWPMADETLRVMDEAGEILPISPPATSIESVAFSPDGRLLAGTRKKEAIVWDAGTHEVLQRLEHRSEVFAIAFSPDGKRLATGGMSSVVRIWDTQSWQHLVDLRGHESYVYDLAFSPDGNHLASAGGDMTVRVWRTGHHPEAEWY